MGTPSSSIFSEIFLQITEHTSILAILNHHNIMGYFRFVDDFLIIYNKRITEIQECLIYNKGITEIQECLRRV